MTSQPDVIAMQILRNISQSKDNQKLKFGYLIEYSIEKHFSSKIIQEMRQRD